MKYAVIIPCIVLWFSSCVNIKVYRAAVAEYEEVNRQYKAARKQLRTTEQHINDVQDSLKILVPYVPLMNKVAVEPKTILSDTNSAAHATWMSTYDRDVLYWLNVARLDPVGFFNRFILKSYREYPSNTYLSSLMETMYSMEPVSALLPDKSLYDAAMCHAKSSGVSGYVGHARVNKQCQKIYTGECCSYGAESPLGVVIQLLVDEDVPSLGHRMLCLDEGFKKAGIASAPHSRYRTNTVIDFIY